MRFVASLLLLLFAQNSLALEVFRNSLASNASEWTFYYNENKKWVLDIVTLGADGWPVLEKSTTFENEKMARVALTAASAQKVRTRRLPDARRVLKGARGQHLWNVTEEWSWEWELKYSEWVKTEIDRFWWLKHGLATDCADVAYSARWIFARNNGLPMANRFGTGQWFTQDSVKAEWAALPTHAEWHKDQKFLAGLNYMLDFVFTHTLWNDSYPIAINAESFIPGAHHLALSRHSGHTQFVYRVGLRPEEVPVLTLNSTVPRAKRELMEFIFQNDSADAGSAAFLRMRWPEVKNGSVNLKDPADMPFYSIEQFDAGFIVAPRTAFWQEVFFRLNPGADFNLIGESMAQQIQAMLKARVDIVEEGYKICSQLHCKEGTAEWEAWSTPSRDNRLRSAIDSFYGVQQYVTDWNKISPIFSQEVLSQEGLPFTVQMLMGGFAQGLPSSNPNDEPITRWGMHPRALSERVQKVFAEGIAAREVAIAKPHTCRDETCLFGSPAFLRAGTYEIDGRLWSAMLHINSYCNLMGDPYCGDVNRRLHALSLNANGETKSIWEWVSDAAYFNSDPRHNHERRFKSFSGEIPHRKANEDKIEMLSAYNKQILYTGYDFLSVSGANILPMPAPAGERAAGLDVTDGWMWTSMGQFVMARKNVGDMPLRFLLPATPELTIAHGGRLLALVQGVVYFLKIENGNIIETGRTAADVMYPHADGLAYLFKEGLNGMIADFKSGAFVELRERNAYVIELKRVGDVYFVKYNSSVLERRICQLIGTDSSVAELTPTGNCIGYVPSQGTGLFEVNGRAIKRTYQDGQLLSEVDVGGLPGYYNEKMLKTEGRRVGEERYFCIASDSVTEVIKPAGVLELTNCNDRYVIEAVTTDNWQVRDRSTGNILLKTVGYLDFTGPDPREHYVFSGSWSLGMAALFDIERPDRFALLTDQYMWAASSGRPADRSTGLVMQKGTNSLWLLD